MGGSDGTEIAHLFSLNLSPTDVKHVIVNLRFEKSHDLTQPFPHLLDTTLCEMIPLSVWLEQHGHLLDLVAKKNTKVLN